MFFLAKYNTQTTFYFPVIKRAAVDFAVAADWTPATGDTKISKDGGNVANTSNNPAIVGGTGAAQWALTLTATELQASIVTIQIVDSATKAIEDQFLVIYTFGNASAQIVNDWSDAVRMGMTALPNAAAEAAGGLYTRGTGAGQIAQDANGNVRANLDTIKTQAVTCAAGVTVSPFVGNATAAQATDASGRVLLQPTQTGVTIPTVTTVTNDVGITQAAADKAWGTTTRVLTAGTNIVLAKGTGLTGLNDIAATAVVSGGAITTSGGAVSTVTTVSNQLTAAQIATGVWQDATAGDFTASNSIGKNLKAGDTTPGEASGHFIAGTNAATSVTTALTANITGNLSGSVGSVAGNTPQTADHTANIAAILAEVTSPDGAVVTDGSNTAISFKTDLTAAVNGYWTDAFMKFKTGSLAGQVKKIVEYNGSTKFVTVAAAFTGTPANGDTFDIINR